jgi:hypothetical protein
MEPISTCLAVLSAVKQGVAMYKDFKSTGKEAYGVFHEISTGLSSFFEHSEKAHAELKEKEKNPPKGKSIQAQALENIMARKQLEQAQYDLRQMLVYESPPELGDLWAQFEKERTKLMADKANFDKAQKKRMNERPENKKKQEMYFNLDLSFVLPYLSLRLPA